MFSDFQKYYKYFLTHHPKKVLAALLILLSFFSYHTTNFKLDASADTLILEDDNDLKVFRDTQDKYKTKDFLVVTYTPNKDLFSPESLSEIAILKDKLLKIDIVDNILTILDVPLLKSIDVPLTEITLDKIKTLKNNQINKELAKKEIVNSHIYKNLIISEDGKTTALVVYLKKNKKYAELLNKKNRFTQKQKEKGLTDNDKNILKAIKKDYEIETHKNNKKRHQAIISIRSILQDHQKTANLYLGGIPMIADDMISFVKKDLIVFGIGVFIFILITLIAIFKSISWFLLPIASCIYAVITMIGLLGILGWKVTVISSNFISLMLILTLSMNIHLIVRYRQIYLNNSDLSHELLIIETLKKMVRPCLYTALTTIIAFGSLVSSGIKPVIDFGWMMSIGLTVTFLTTFTLFPSLLLLMGKPKAINLQERKSKICQFLGELTTKNRVGVIILASFISLVGLLGIVKLEVENSFINYFDKKTEIYQGMKLIDDKLGGTNPLDIILKFTDTNQPSLEDDEDDLLDWETDYVSENYWFTSEKIEKIREIHDYLDLQPEIGKVLSLVSIIRVAEDLNKGKKFDALELAVLNKKIPPKLKEEIINPFISIENNEARLTVRVLDSQDDLRRGELIERIYNDLENQYNLNKNEFTITGVLVLYNNMLQSLFQSQILSLGIVMLGIAMMFLILFRSVLLSIIGIVPNVLAAAIILGLMGWIGAPLDMMTITIAAITIGIAVDNSIHYIYRFKEEYTNCQNYNETLHICHSTIAKAILNTSITIIFGFSILIFSNFIPTIYFGVLTALAMAIALLASLTVLPALLLLTKPFKNQTY